MPAKDTPMGFWKNKNVFITGHTGFKGSWLCLWLEMLGANITGYALAPNTAPNLYDICKIGIKVESIISDIRDLEKLKRSLKEASPEIVIHMAAQPLVRESYKQPVETYDTNIMGTVNLLEAVKNIESVKAIVVVTTDKVYENKISRHRRFKGFKENEPLGGYDPYSSSKACAEIVVSAYRDSFNLNVASARAGNVIGGGDWSADRLIPDFLRAIDKGDKIQIRNPKATRPWQHVLEPLSGYLLLAQRLYETPIKYAQAWNFGPKISDTKEVLWIIKQLCSKLGNSDSYSIDRGKHPHEAAQLVLNCDKAKKLLNWQPKWNIETALDKTIDWIKAYNAEEDMANVCLRQIQEYLHNKHLIRTKV